MTLLSPLALFGLLALPLLVVFYLFRPEPRQHKSTTYFLWREAVPDSQGGTFARRLQSNPLLWLQLLVLLLLVLFLCRLATPWTSQTPTASRVILILDRSASLKAENAFERARETAKEAVNSMLGFRFSGSTPEVMLIAVDREAQVLVPFTKDASMLQEALDNLQVTDLPDQLETLGPFLKSLVKAHKAKIWLIGDRLPTELQVGGLQFTSVASKLDNNTGVSSFSVRNPDPERGQKKPFLYSRVDNFSNSAQRRILRLEKMNPEAPDRVEAVLLERTLMLAAQSGQTVMEPLSASRFEPDAASVFRMTLSPVPGEEADVFAPDDQAFCVVPPFQQEKILVALAPGFKAGFLLRAIAASAGSKVVKLSELLAKSDPPPIDLLLCSPDFKVPKDLDVHSRFFLAPPPSDSEERRAGRLQMSGENPPLVSDSGVEWSRQSVQITLTEPLGQGEIPLLESGGLPALSLSGLNEGVPSLHWKFPLAYSSLPLSTGLPVVVGRFIDTYSRRAGVTLEGSGATGLALKRPTGYHWAGTLQLSPLSKLASSRAQERLISAESPVIPPPTYCGIYTLAAERSGATQLLAVNLFSHQESALERTSSDASFESEFKPSADEQEQREQTQYREVGSPFLFLCLLLLLLEAWVFLKRGRP